MPEQLQMMCKPGGAGELISLIGEKDTPIYVKF